MGLLLHVARTVYSTNDSDSTNGGVSGQSHLLLCVNIRGPIDNDTDRLPKVMLHENSRGNPIIVPATQDENGEWVPLRPEGMVGPMAGGNYATGDSRFSERVPFYGAVPIHDRFETPAQYSALSI